MLDANTGGGSASGAAPALWTPNRLRNGLAVLILIGIAAAAYLIYQSEGTSASFSLLIGAAFGIALERGRFCFFCILRDYIEFGNSAPIFSILAALAVGGIGYAIVFGAFLPNAMGGRLPPDAHVGPVSPVLVVAGLAFGVGMALSGACISGHLYRLGEGYARAPIALIGSLIGFGLGFFTWQRLYLEFIISAPVPWLPATFGYGGALVIHLLVLGIIAAVLWRALPELKASPGGKITFSQIYDSIFRQRWNPLATGAVVGLIGIFAYLRVEPLGVTAQLGSVSRTALAEAGYLTGRLPGLDTFAGCATVVARAVTDNGYLIIGLVLASFSMALLANRFQLSKLTPLNSFTALLGGLLMGWGAMLALGCTVGTLLSGISAFALSGWVFGAAVFVGVWLGIKLKLVG